MIHVAYIGFGVSAREYHIPYVEKRDDVQVKYVFRREEDIAQFAEYEPFYPEITFTTDLNDVLCDPEVDLVAVNAPDRFRVPYAKQILNAGKHALVEKPFAPTAVSLCLRCSTTPERKKWWAVTRSAPNPRRRTAGGRWFIMMRRAER